MEIINPYKVTPPSACTTTTTEVPSIVIDSNSKWELLAVFWSCMREELWFFFFLTVFISCITENWITLGLGEDAFPIILFLTTLIVAAVITFATLVGLAYFMYSIHNGRGHIVCAYWNSNTRFNGFFFGAFKATAIFERIKLGATRKPEATFGKGTTTPLVLDSTAKRELMMEYWFMLINELFILFFTVLITCLYGVGVIIYGREEIASLFAVAISTVVVRFILVIGKACFVILFRTGHEGTVVAWNQKLAIMILFDTFKANAILHRHIYINDDSITPNIHDLV
ncbi:hypothetical protein ABFS82_13G162400 [Erythranthe guttata]